MNYDAAVAPIHRNEGFQHTVTWTTGFSDENSRSVSFQPDIEENG